MFAKRGLKKSSLQTLFWPANLSRRTWSGIQIGGHTEVMVSQAQNIEAGIQQAITLDEVGHLGLELGLDPNFTNLIGLSLGAIQGNIITNPGSPLEYAFSNVLPDLEKSMAIYGVDRLGESLGLDPRVASLVESSVGTALEQGLTNGNLFGEGAIAAIESGLLKGAASVAIGLATKDMDPLVAALTARTVSGVLEGVLSDDHDIFSGVYNAFAESTIHLFDVDNPAQLLDFSHAINQRGLIGALEDNAVSVFGNDAVESMVVSAGSVGNYLEKMVVENRVQAVTLDDDVQALSIPLNEDGSNFILVSPDETQLLGRKINGVYEEGDYVKAPDGSVLLGSGEQYIQSVDGSYAIAEKENGQYNQIHVKSATQDMILSAENNQPLKVAQKGSELQVVNGSAEDLMSGIKLTYSDGVLVSKETTTGSLEVAYDALQQKYIETPYAATIKEVYSKDLGNLEGMFIYQDLATAAVLSDPGFTWSDASANLNIPMLQAGQVAIITPQIMSMPTLGADGVAGFVTMVGPNGVMMASSGPAGTSTNSGFVGTIKSWIGNIIKWFNGKDPDPDALAEDIGSGHAYEKHVQKRGEFPGINSVQEFIEFIKDIIKNPSEYKKYFDNKTQSWKEAWWKDDGTLVIRDPDNPDQGTAFRPKEGKSYYDKLGT